MNGSLIYIDKLEYFLDGIRHVVHKRFIYDFYP